MSSRSKISTKKKKQEKIVTVKTKWNRVLELGKKTRSMLEVYTIGNNKEKRSWEGLHAFSLSKYQNN